MKIQDTEGKLDLAPAPRLEEPCVVPNLGYLCPARYFRFYLFYERASNRTCWLPQGYNA